MAHPPPQEIFEPVRSATSGPSPRRSTACRRWTACPARPRSRARSRAPHPAVAGADRGYVGGCVTEYVIFANRRSSPPIRLFTCSQTCAWTPPAASPAANCFARASSAGTYSSSSVMIAARSDATTASASTTGAAFMITCVSATRSVSMTTPTPAWSARGDSTLPRRFGSAITAACAPSIVSAAAKFATASGSVFDSRSRAAPRWAASASSPFHVSNGRPCCVRSPLSSSNARRSTVLARARGYGSALTRRGGWWTTGAPHAATTRKTIHRIGER